MTKSHKFDVVIVGAGTSGSATAYYIAEKGFSVAVIDKMSLDNTGARWSNALCRSDFDETGIPYSEPPELENRSSPVGIKVYGENKCIKITKETLWNINMPELCQRLQKMAKDEGAIFFGNLNLHSVNLKMGRPVSIVVNNSLNDSNTEKIEFTAKLFVDATGLSGHLRQKIPQLNKWCPPVNNSDICTAMQQVCEISDVAKAKQFLSENEIEPGTVLNIAGVAGGWSTYALRVSEDFRHVALLAGCIADGTYSTGPNLMRKLVEEHPWIGRQISGGSGLIPIRHTYDVFTSPGVALVGDSACHTFPAHGSGVGNGIKAGKMLSEAIAQQTDPGAWKYLWKYQAKFQREIGSVNAVYDIFRRLTQSVTRDDLALMLEKGMINADSSRLALIKEIPVPTLNEAQAFIRTVLKKPQFSFKAIPQSAKMPALFSLYKLYPQSPDMNKIKLWSKTVAGIYGNKPEIY